ncbi:hypothetical protein Taro_055848 [Colocasia esculenta]|uniref:Uncharacterized protein n=1 Tax=Colocasia esculenta TaxID=4460 RepID=A0A843XUU0_COLES|nr:hypothetical protein [Colocasia esculenta]
MYVTRRLSSYHGVVAAASPAEGPPTGVLLIHDQEWPTVTRGRIWGREQQMRDTQLRSLPFPQDMTLSVTYRSTMMYHIDSPHPIVWSNVLFLPVLGQPASANRYYVIGAKRSLFHGEKCNHLNMSGALLTICGDANVQINISFLICFHGLFSKACSSSTEELTETCCCCCSSPYRANQRQNMLDPRDIYQQMEMVPRGTSRFYARSVAPGGVPPAFLKGESEGTEVRAEGGISYRLLPADGVDGSLRARLPRLDFPIGGRPEAVVVGRWYCPFVFVREGRLKPKDQMKQSTYYTMELEQSWEDLSRRENATAGGRAPVLVAEGVRTEDVVLWGRCEVKEERDVKDGFMHFSPEEKKKKKKRMGGVALSMAIVEKVRWEEQRVGWVGGHDGCGVADQRVMEKEEEPDQAAVGEGRGWRKFGCYVLVERFLLKRTDGTLVLTWEFRRLHQVRSKWEYA